MKHFLKFWMAGMLSVLTMLLAGASTANAAVATWNANTEPDVAGYKLSYGKQSGVYNVVIDVGKVTTYTFNPPAGFRYYVVVQAYNIKGQLSDKSAEVVIDIPAANLPPAVSQPTNQTNTVNTNVSFTFAASDPERKPLKFSAKGLPPGLSISSTSPVIAGSPRTAGVYPVTITVSDGALSTSRAFSWVITQASASMVLDLPAQDTTLLLNTVNQSAHGSLMVYTWPANRVAGNILMKFDLSHIPTTAVIQSATLTMSLTAFDSTIDNSYTVSLHQVINRNPDIARATGYMADGLRAWTANSCCASSVPMAIADISPARSTLVVDRSVGKKTWDAKALVTAWVASPSSNLGLLLKADTSKGEGRYRTFASSENPSASSRPFLRVTYSVPTTATGALAPAATSTATSTSGDSFSISGRSAEASTIVEPSGSAVEEDPSTGVSGDFDGDGRADLATYQQGEWRIWTSSSNFLEPTIVAWGEADDVPVPADYNGDRVTDLALYRPSTATWFWWLPNARTPSTVRWGAPGDRPLTIDYDGDGKADLGLARDGNYLVLLSSSNYMASVTIR